MKFMNLRLQALLVALSLFLNLGAKAEIREIQSMKEALSYVDQDTLVVFDIDNTTIRPTQSLGSDQFFSYLLTVAAKRGLEGPAAVAWALETATPIQPVSPVLPVEPETPGMIRDLQGRGLNVFALTARPHEWFAGTLRQLRSVGVEFSLSAPPLSGIEEGVHFQAPGREKGPDLVELIGQMKTPPRKVVFIDDKLKNVKSVEDALEKTTIPHFSLRYGAADAWVKAFDPRIAEIEWKHFRESGQFMSDEEAARQGREENGRQAAPAAPLPLLFAPAS